MISFILFNIVFLVAIYNVYRYMFDRPKNFPPGPPRIPFFGSYLFLLLLNYDHFHLAVNKLCKFYKSNIIGFYLGGMLVVVLNDGDKVKKALMHRDFDGRPDILIARLREPKMNLFGIIFTETDHWHEQRRFALRHLRDYGFGRRFESLEKEIQQELSQYMEVLKYGPTFPHEKKYVKKGMVNLPNAFGPIFGNCFLQVLFEERIPPSEMDALYEIAESAIVFQRNTDPFGKLYSTVPLFAKLCPDRSGFTEARNASNKLHLFFKKRIDHYIDTFDDTYDRNFIDMYIRKIKEAEESGDKSTFTYDQLIMTCVDFTFPSLSALSPTITFLIQKIFLEPSIQTKIQNEIDRVVGSGRMPSLDDRINLPYTEACLREIMRFETLVPSGLPHCSLQDTEFLGYSIPKKTIILPSLGQLHEDKEFWKNPDIFQPERLLDSDGKLLLAKDKSLPFGAGNRLCAGETFARNMLFLFTTAVFQSFSVKLPDGQKPIEFADNSTGLIRMTPDHWVELVAR